MKNQSVFGKTGLPRMVATVATAISLVVFGFAGNALAGQQTFSASGTFTKPSGVTQVTIQAWGGGGAGGWSATKTTGATGGGGGGAYASSVLTGLPSAQTDYTITIGAGGTCSATVRTNGGNSIFGANQVVAAGGSTPAALDEILGAAGGTVAASIGTTRYAGGAGADAKDNPNGYGGGGGSSAGTGAGGVAGSLGAGATAPAGGGSGGDGATASGGAGAAGTVPGGAGGGALRTGGAVGGGAGAAGRVIVNWGPTVTIEQGGSQADPTNTTPITFDVVFSEDVTGFAIADIVLAGTATGKSVTNVSGSGTTYTVTVTATGGGTIIASIPAGVVVDGFGNANFASTSTDNTVTYTTATAPTVTINQAGGQVDPTNGTILYTVVFSENVTGFAAGDVVLGGTAIASVTNVAGGPATYTVTVTGTDSGDVTADIPAGIATGSVSGLLNVASTSTDNLVIFDNLKPSVTIEQGGAQADPTATSPITFDVVFSESVSGFAAADVSLTGSTATATVTGVSGSGTTYAVTVTPTTNGTVVTTIPAGGAADAAANTNYASSSTDNSVEFTGAACVDPSPSTITIPSSQTVGGLGVDLASLFSTTGNVTAFTYTIESAPVDSPWNSGAYGTTGAEVVTLVVSGTDPDCGGVPKSATNTITVDNSSLNFLLHNSQVTSSTKWPIAQSGKTIDGWGIVNAQYGEFTCATCHTRATTNIKRIKTTLTAPADTFPIGGGAVELLTAAEGASHYGDDAGGHATSSRICEACHSKNKFHNYDTANNLANGGNLTHANLSDCMVCHPHKQGFKSPGCNSCHGNPPTGSGNVVFSPAATGALADPATAPGAHGRHAQIKAMACETCHKGNTMPTVSYTIQMGFDASTTNVPGWFAAGPVTGGTITVPQNPPMINGYTFASSDGATTVTEVGDQNLNCTVYCHGNWANSGGSVTNPSWVGVDQAICGACHSTSTATPPQTGSHNVHVLSTGNVKLTCNKCHPSYSDTVHLNGNVAWQLATADTRIGASGKYRGAASGTTGAKAPSITYGTCSTVYCHGSNTPTWGGPNIDCAGCHSGNEALAGSHAKHYASATVTAANTTTNDSTAVAYVFQCGTCHKPASTMHSGGVVSSNQAAEVILNGGGTYTAGGTLAGTDGSFNYTAGTCGFNACHNNGKAVLGAPNVVATWTVALPANCTGCHNNDAASGAPMVSNAHSVHVSDAAVMSIKPCQMCHDATVDADNRVVTDKTVHVNGARDIAMIPSYDSDGNPTNNWNGTNCTNVYCHSNGQAVPTRTYQSINWITTIGCTGCHGGAGITTTLSGKHLAHTGTDPTAPNHQFAYSCNVCHAQTASNNTTIGTIANHINTVRDVAVSGTVGGTGNNDTDYVGYVLPDTDPRYGIQSIYTCASNNCHGSGSAGWDGSAALNAIAAKNDCSLCHGMSKLGQAAPAITVYDTSGDTSDGDFQVGAHAAHLNVQNGYSAPIACDQCHNATVSEMALQGTYVAKVKVVGHIDSSQPAEITYGSIATAGGATTNYNPATRVCSNYCHGATLANAFDPNPAWEQNAYLNGTFSVTGDCNRCHGAPPLITGHTGSETLADCGKCHNQTMTEGIGNAFADKTKHINGNLEVSTSCGSCHGQLPPNTGSHPKHGVHLVQDLGYSNGSLDGTLADWNATNYPACAVCHDMTSQDYHLGVTSNIMGPAKPDEAFAPNYPVAGPGYPVYDSGTQSCSNARCHFKPTPDWNP